MRNIYSSAVLFVFAVSFGYGQSDSDSLLNNLPPHIKQITHFGERADWSHDGERILFLEKTFGDVFEVEVATGIIRPMTHHFFHEGFVRGVVFSQW